MQIITLEDKHSAAGLCPRLTVMLPQAGNRARAAAIPGNLPDSAHYSARGILAVTRNAPLGQLDGNCGL
jgi:hypothetical protein